MTRLTLGLAALWTVGCGGEDGSGGHPRETDEYRAFLSKQFKIRILGGGPLRGSIILEPPAPQALGQQEFFEIFVNGEKLDRFRLDANALTARFEDVRLNSGANRIAVWDSSLNRGFSETLDSRAGKVVEIRAGGIGWEMQARPE